MKKLIVSLLFVTMFVSCQQQNYDEQKQRCINFIEKGEKFTQVAASARYNIWSEKLNPALNDEKKQKEMEDVYAQNSQEAKHYLDSINTETKSLKDIDVDWYNGIFQTKVLEEPIKRKTRKSDFLVFLLLKDLFHILFCHIF